MLVIILFVRILNNSVFNHNSLLKKPVFISMLSESDNIFMAHEYYAFHRQAWPSLDLILDLVKCSNTKILVNEKDSNCLSSFRRNILRRIPQCKG